MAVEQKEMQVLFFVDIMASVSVGNRVVRFMKNIYSKLLLPFLTGLFLSCVCVIV